MFALPCVFLLLPVTDMNEITHYKAGLFDATLGVDLIALAMDAIERALLEPLSDDEFQERFGPLKEMLARLERLRLAKLSQTHGVIQCH